MNRMQEQVVEFHRACEVPVLERPVLPLIERRRLRFNLIKEELTEFSGASFGTGTKPANITEAADALIDILYVTFGACLEYGIDAQAVFDEVHRSNMLKVGPDGKVRRREDGKILKPEGWQKPDVAKVLFGEKCVICETAPCSCVGL